MAERDDLIPVGFRLPAGLIDRIDAWRGTAEAKVPGVRLSRSNAIRALLELALTAEGFPAEPAAKGKRGK